MESEQINPYYDKAAIRTVLRALIRFKYHEADTSFIFEFKNGFRVQVALNVGSTATGFVEIHARAENSIGFYIDTPWSDPSRSPITKPLSMAEVHLLLAWVALNKRTT